MAQEGVTMDRLTEWIGEGEDRHAIPRMDLRKTDTRRAVISWQNMRIWRVSETKVDSMQ